MDVHKAGALLKAVDAGSLMKAADLLGYTPSGLVHMMNGLEKQIGLKLVDRGRFGVRLTAEGRALYPLLKDFVQLNDKIEAEIAQIKQIRENSIRIGAYSSISIHWLPEMIQGFKEINPLVNFEITVGSIYELSDQLKENELDLYIAGFYEGSGLEFFPLQNDRLMVILPPSHPKAQQKTFSIEQLNGEIFIMPSFGMDYEIGALLTQAQISTQRQTTLVDDGAVLSMVAKGLGISILSELVIKSYSANVSAIPLEPLAFRHLGIAIKSSESCKEIVKQFIQYALKLNL